MSKVNEQIQFSKLYKKVMNHNCKCENFNGITIFYFLFFPKKRKGNYIKSKLFFKNRKRTIERTGFKENFF